MQPDKRTLRLEIQVGLGRVLHLRDLARLVLAASAYPCVVEVVFEDRHVDAKSLIALATLPLKRAEVFCVEARGEGAALCLRAIDSALKERVETGTYH